MKALLALLAVALLGSVFLAFTGRKNGSQLLRSPSRVLDEEVEQLSSTTSKLKFPSNPFPPPPAPTSAPTASPPRPLVDGNSTTKGTMFWAMSKWCDKGPTEWDASDFASAYGSIEEWNITFVTDMSSLVFKYCGREGNSSLPTPLAGNITNPFAEPLAGNVTRDTFNARIGDWDTSSVTTMRLMFGHTSEFNSPIGAWNVAKVTSMANMFQFSSFNQTISDWDISSVTNMARMFRSSDFDQHIGNWKTSNVTNMNGLFYSSSFDKPIGTWDTSNVINMENMFIFSHFDQEIGDWDIGSVTNVNNMFMGSLFNKPIGNWTTSSVVVMNSMFRLSWFNESIERWDTSNVTDMEGMFSQSHFNQEIGGWNVSSVTRMANMFRENFYFTKDITGWTTDTSDFDSRHYVDMFARAYSWLHAYEYTAHSDICNRDSPDGPAECWSAITPNPTPSPTMPTGKGSGHG